jgi:hypothetical protein
MASFDGVVLPLAKQDFYLFRSFFSSHVLDQATKLLSCGYRLQQYGLWTQIRERLSEEIKFVDCIVIIL